MSVKFLVVDDSGSVQSFIRNALSDYQVIVVRDTHKAMRQIYKKKINFVVIDLSKTNLAGFQLLNKIKSDQHFKKIRILVITNDDLVEADVKALGLSAIDYIRLPIEAELFQERIKIHVELLYALTELEDDIDKQETIFNLIFRQSPMGIAISYSHDPFSSPKDNKIIVNPKFTEIIGRDEQEFIELGWAKITHHEDLEADLDNFWKLQLGAIESYSMDKRYIRPDGSIVWVHMIVARLILPNDNRNNHICLVQDITSQKEIEADLGESERSKSVLLSHLPGMAYRCNFDDKWTMHYVSAGCRELTGYSQESFIYNQELSFQDVIVEKYRNGIREEWQKAVNDRLTYSGEYEILTKSGELKWVMEMGQAIYKRGEVEALEGIILDISDRKKIEQDLVYNLQHDRWTGLYNQTYLETVLRRDAKKAFKTNRALVGINLSYLHSLNMVYGFQYTRELIKDLANALRVYGNNNRFLFIIYEHYFVFYLQSYQDKNELNTFCNTIANQLETLLTIERVETGIGVVEITPDNLQDPDQLLKSLLVASEKSMGSLDELAVCFFDQEMEAAVTREDDIKRELATDATNLESQQLYLQFQPIFDLKADRICGFEALARFNSQQYGLVSPAEFIPLAEETKLIIPLGNKIIMQALTFLRRLYDNGYDSLNVSINISATQFLKRDFVANLFDMIKEVNVSPENITLEITESVFAANYEDLNRVLGELKTAGIHISIDDFGTGYSSLERERDLNVNSVKIDKTFIDRLMYLEEKDSITSDIISMAHKIGHSTVAEGVEHEKQRQYLLKWGCDKIQGYLISKPLDEADAFQFLTENYKW